MDQNGKDEREPLANTSLENGNRGARSTEQPSELERTSSLYGVQLEREDEPVTVKRRVFTQEHFDKHHGFSQRRKSKTPKEHAHHVRRKLRNRCACSRDCIQGFLLRLFPFVSIMRQYKFPQWFVGDLVSGLTVGVMHLPQGMAYALLAGLPSIHGLYVSFFPPLVYFFFGTSKHISIGTMAVVSLMVGAVVDRQAVSWTAPAASPDVFNDSSVANATSVPTIICDADTNSNQDCVDFKIGVATALTMLVGFWQLLKGTFRLGFITNYLSDPLISGFTTGAACHVFSSQIKHVFGLRIKASKITNPFKLVKFYIQFFLTLPQTNLAALIMSVVCILMLVLTKECINARYKAKMKMPVPIELIVVILGTMVSYFAKMDEVFNLTVVGSIPTGIPVPTLPPAEHFGTLIVDAFGVAIVAFTISVSMAKILAKQQGYVISPDQELIAYGMCNIIGSVFTTFSCCASMSRSLVQETTGGKTEVASIVSSGFILIVILAAGPLFRTLPRCVLASIIIVALKGMFLQVKDLKRLWRISKFDFAIWIVTFVSVVFLNVDMGLLVGVGFSLITIVFRTQWPYSCLFGRVPHTDIYRDKNVYKVVEEVPGIKIFHFESSLYYANAEHFRNKLYSTTGCDPGLLKAERMAINERQEALAKQKKKKEKREKKKENANQTEKEADDHPSIALVDESKQADKHLLSLEDELPQPDIHHIIVDCSAMTFIDAVGVKVLKQVIAEYKAVGVRVVLAHCRAQLGEMLEKCMPTEDDQEDLIYFMVHDAVLVALDKERTLREKCI
ncbi:prestin [Lingula anatina]|uniref:Prestin n=1 Tax=Lingula anatina TaxID=7574 RepID=A0A1S3JPE7_LINAN|nr:prestin [Lingula anatina]|eukprot:XP_013411874.1 prestin [Lingula anatina]